MERQFIKILFCGGIHALEKEIVSGLTYDDIIYACLDHIKNIICDGESEASQYIAMYLPAFGLRLPKSVSGENPIWLPYWHKFHTNQEGDGKQKHETFEFRVRHRPFVFFKSQSIMEEYLFIQMVDDFLHDPDFPIKDIAEKIFTLLLSIAVLVQEKDLPLRNAQIVDPRWETRPLEFPYVLKFQKRLSISKVLSDRLTGEKFWQIEKKYWAFVMLIKNVNDIKKRRFEIGYLKEIFHNFLVNAVPDYCHEIYQVNLSHQPSPVSAMMNLNCENNGLYYGKNQECLLSEIEEMKLVNPTNLRDEKWAVQIHLRQGIPKELHFKTKSEAESFLSMAQTKAKLCVRWDCFLSYHELTSRELMDLQLKSFGPLFECTAKQHLLELCDKPAFQGRGFLIHQSPSEFKVYVVVSCVQTDNTLNQCAASGAFGMERLVFERHHILMGAEGDLRMVGAGDLSGDGVQYGKLEELTLSLLTRFGVQACPSDYRNKADINVEYGNNNEDDLARTLQLPEEEMPSVFLTSYLKDKTEIKDKNIKIRKYKVHYNEKALMMVRVVTTDQEDTEAFLEGLERLEKLRRVEPQRFLKLHNIVLGSKLTFITELPTHGDLLTYICLVPQSSFDKLKLMKQVVSALLAIDKCKHFHGNIRSRKFLVFDEPGVQTVRLKLEFSGVTSMLDTKPLDHELNVERLAWLSPERRENLPKITYESECYSVGTTLAEIVHRTDNFAEIVNLSGNEEIPPPKGCNSDNREADEVDLLWQSVWNLVVRPCWNPEPSLRPVPNKLMADVVDLLKKADGISRDRVEEVKEIEYTNLGPSEIDSAPSKEQLREELQQKFKDLFSCDELKFLEELGKGNFGRVWKAQLIEAVQNGPVPLDSTVVPVKRLVAIKAVTYKKDYTEDNFRREIFLANKFKHENVVELIKCGYFPCHYDATKTQLGLISEFMDMGSLDKHLGSCNYELVETIEKLKSICLDVAKGMAYISGRNIVHRDLAPRNILLKNIGGGRPRAKVSDFGLSRMMDDDYKFYRCQTIQDFPWPTWPPECLTDDLTSQRFTTEGDVWSFGILLWLVFYPKGNLLREMNNNAWRVSRRPRESGIVNLNLARDLYQSGWRPSPHERTPDSLYQMMWRCWHKECKERPAFVVLVEDLNSLQRSYFFNM